MSVALVTGASQGIGKAIALGLVEDGYSVGLLARNKGKLEAIKEQIGNQAVVLPADVREHSEIQAAVSKLKDTFGTPDLVFNNAGIYRPGSAEMPEETFDELVSTNLLGAWNVLNAVVPLLKARKSGLIINLSSIVGTIAPAGVGAYSASKFGLSGLSESLFRELAPQGIGVTTICPSWVATDMAAHSSIPNDAKIQPADILQTVRYLRDLGPGACLKEMVIHCRSDIL